MVGMRNKQDQQTISIGISDELTIVNDVGNPYLHKRQDVHVGNVDGTKVGRAIVFDQHIIDILYTQEKINEKQHNVCDKYLFIISQSGAFATAPSSMERILTSHSFLQTELKPVSCLKHKELLLKNVVMKQRKFFGKL